MRHEDVDERRRVSDAQARTINPAAKAVISVFLIGVGLSALISIVGARVTRHAADSALPVSSSPAPRSKVPRSFANLKRDLPADRWWSVYDEAELARRRGDGEAFRAFPGPPAGTTLSSESYEKLTEQRAVLSGKYVEQVRSKYHLTEAEMSALIIWGKTSARTYSE